MYTTAVAVAALRDIQQQVALVGLNAELLARTAQVAVVVEVHTMVPHAVQAAAWEFMD